PCPGYANRRCEGRVLHRCANRQDRASARRRSYGSPKPSWKIVSVNCRASSALSASFHTRILATAPQDISVPEPTPSSTKNRNASEALTTPQPLAESLVQN